jgi:hypothetical protein
MTKERESKKTGWYLRHEADHWVHCHFFIRPDINPLSACSLIFYEHLKHCEISDYKKIHPLYQAKYCKNCNDVLIKKRVL